MKRLKQLTITFDSITNQNKDILISDYGFEKEMDFETYTYYWPCKKKATIQIFSDNSIFINIIYGNNMSMILNLIENKIIVIEEE